jgi:hypothetical protein
MPKFPVPGRELTGCLRRESAMFCRFGQPLAGPLVPEMREHGEPAGRKKGEGGKRRGREGHRGNAD